MLAIAAWLAIRDAVAGAAPNGRPVALDAPATPERILAAIEAARAAGGNAP
jgi:xanthine dehydrogenase large subunit